MRLTKFYKARLNKVRPYKARLNSDKGGAVTILSLGLILLIIVMGAFMIDYTKNISIKDTYHSYAQYAVQTAIQEQDFTGGLSPNAANVALNEYLRLREQPETNMFRNRCGGSYPRVEIAFDNEIQKGISNNSVIYNSSGSLMSGLPAYFQGTQYKVITMRVVDVSDNMVMGVFNLPCQVYTVSASAKMVDSYDY